LSGSTFTLANPVSIADFATDDATTGGTRHGFDSKVRNRKCYVNRDHRPFHGRSSLSDEVFAGLKQNMQYADIYRGLGADLSTTPHLRLESEVGR